MSEPTEPQMLSRFIDGLKQAAGSAHQLAHAQRNPGWLRVRDLLDGVINQGIAMATAKPLTEQETQRAVDVRQRARRFQ